MIGLWLLSQGQVGAGIWLQLWGALATRWIDKLVRGTAKLVNVVSNPAFPWASTARRPFNRSAQSR